MENVLIYLLQMQLIFTHLKLWIAETQLQVGLKLNHVIYRLKGE